MKYIFQLGFAPKLSWLELTQFLSAFRIKTKKASLSPNLIQLETSKPLPTTDIITQLAGTIRIAEFLTPVSRDHLTQTIAHRLSLLDKSNFACLWLDNPQGQTQLHHHIKKVLKSANHHARFILANKLFPLPIHTTKDQIQEFIITGNTNRLNLFQVTHVSNTQNWQATDQSRQVDAKSGILPPKVARIMVNLARYSNQGVSDTLLDPMCGSGTILTEAVRVGCRVLGVDQDPAAIRLSQANLSNLASADTFSLILGDSTTFPFSHQSLAPFSAVAFEGYLGPSHSDPSTSLPELISNLEHLHTQIITNLFSSLANQAQVVVALPYYHHPATVKSLKNLIDTCENTGYTPRTGPIVYGQPHARVKRAIYILQKS